VTDPTASRDSSDTVRDPSSDRRTTDFGVICCQRSEVRPLLVHVDRQRKYTDERMTFRGGFINETIRVALVEAGNGYAKHRRAAEILIREHRPRWVFSVGYCSALDESIEAGDIVLANQLADTHGNSLDIPCRIQSSRRVHVGPCVVADAHPFHAQDKAALAASSQAIAVDTVSLAAAQVCQSHDVRFLSIRSVVDTVHEEMPELARDLLYRPTGKAWGGAVGGIVKNFRRAAVLNEWRKRSVEAAEHLAKFTGSLIVRIAERLDR
jgi:nucleoside phosphorylase